DGTLQRDNGGLKLARPLSAVVIPDTVQGVIMARIDRLPEAPKAALQVASVIGREFSAQLVERVAALPQDARQALGELRAVELIYQKSAFPELAYLFKHALTHDVAYESLLKQHRRALHRRAGEVIEDLYAERLSEFYEALAGHYLQGEVWPRAVEYCLKAAGKARAHYAYRQAIRQCEDAPAGPPAVLRNRNVSTLFGGALRRISHRHGRPARNRRLRPDPGGLPGPGPRRGRRSRDPRPRRGASRLHRDFPGRLHRCFLRRRPPGTGGEAHPRGSADDAAGSTRGPRVRTAKAALHPLRGAAEGRPVPG